MTDRSGRALPLSMDRALEQYDSKFRFVLLASSRAEQLIRGARPKIEGAATRKHTRLAMEELKGGMIEWGYGPPPEAEPIEGEGTAAGTGDEAGGASEQ
jgi:DNA-directed RNA polymerase omega subunit